MKKKSILFIGGSLNQTTMMYKISQYFDKRYYDCYFTHYYANGFLDYLAEKNFLDFTILGGRFKKNTIEYLEKKGVKTDFKGKDRKYDVVFTCQDLIIPKNIRDTRIVLIQEGMTDPENLMYHVVKKIPLPRWLAGTAATGLSDMYELFFVASEGYRELFISKGVKPEKIIVTGIPNFDNVKEFLNNNFPYKNYVLAATSDRRETFNYENRKKFIQKVNRIANGRQIIYKLHPNENWERAIKEINKYSDKALIFTDIDINPLIANCDVLVTKYSSVVYIGLALGKEVYSDFDINFLKKMVPIQNNGTSAEKIAKIVREKFFADYEKEVKVERENVQQFVEVTKKTELSTVEI